MPPEAPFAPMGAPRAAQAERPVRKPSTPYDVQPFATDLVRTPGAPMDGGVAPPAPPPPPARQEPLRLPARSRSGFAPAKAGRADAAPAPAPEPARETGTPAAPGAAGKKRRRGWRFLRRHERFCMAYVLGGNATRAAWDAGYSPAHGGNQGYRLLKRPEIQARIAEIQRGFGRSFAGDVEVLLGKLESAYGQAVAGGYYNAAARIVEVQARIAGHLKSRIAPPASVENGENDEK